MDENAGANSCELEELPEEVRFYRKISCKARYQRRHAAQLQKNSLKHRKLKNEKCGKTFPSPGMFSFQLFEFFS
ncbi:MAG: hypothetical protein QM426_11640 [Euryarchaeota archaeon]|nr:hypothetical protein [Euryarchaeota archaeon]